MTGPGPQAGHEVEIGDAMGQALLHVVPLALTAALSSVPISATIFILLSEGRTRSGLAFLAGTVIGTFVAISLVTAAGQALPGRPRHHEALIDKLEVVVGIAMVLFGVYTLARASAASGRGARWMEGLGSLGVVPVLGIGLALNLRPKAILLVAAAGLAISKARLPLEENLVLIVVYAAIATCTVVVPIVVTILFPHRMEPRLLAAKEWIAAHSTGVSATLMILIGGFVMYVGISG
jgi:Sap-like sulfolipid-1-addressing protein